MIFFYVVVCYNYMNFVYFFLLNGGVDINSRIFNGLILFYLVVVCGVIDVIDVLFYYGVNFELIDENGFIVLYYIVFNIYLN